MTDQELKSLKEQIAVLQFDRMVADQRMASIVDALEEFLSSGGDRRPFREIQKDILVRRLNAMAARVADESHSFASMIKDAIDDSLNSKK
jgi:hypothetical protein